MLSVVMYHYVRPLKESKFPNIKGLELSGFRRQLDYLVDNFSIVDSDAILAWATNGEQLPEDACYLTFDDGYKDHIDFVLPELNRRGLHGAFFPPIKAIGQRKLLDVNMIHFILASASNPNKLADELDSILLSLDFSSSDLKRFRQLNHSASRFDTAEVIYLKRMLQHTLPEKIRNEISETLFQKYVGVTTSQFADDLYMNQQDLRSLVAQGMYVGGHGIDHIWLNKVSVEKQEFEIRESLKFLTALGIDSQSWIMCYPYGGYNDDTLQLLKKYNCKVGLTTKVDYASNDAPNFLTLSRFDTNDYPQ